MLSLEDYDKHVKPALWRIEAFSESIVQRVNYIRMELRYLRSRPEWLTKAEDELRKAKEVLQDALSELEEAEKKYKNLPGEK